MNLKPAAIELDVGAASKCPLWVKSGHMQRNSPCLLYPESDIKCDLRECPLWARSDKLDTFAHRYGVNNLGTVALALGIPQQEMRATSSLLCATL